MPRLLQLLLIFLVIPLPTLAAPSLAVKNLEYDFGEVPQGNKVSYTFRFRNDGDELLEILSVSSSCGCTAALLSSRRIAPGDMGEVKAVFDSSRFRGRVTKTITLKTNAPDHPQVYFKLKGTVKELLGISTTRISWTWATPGLIGHAKVILSNHSQQQIVLQAARTTNPQLTATLDRLDLPPGEKAILSVSGSLPSGEKRINGYVLVNTNFKPVSQLRVSVSGRLK